MRLILVAEALILSARYIREHTEEGISTREVNLDLQYEKSIYGIGFEPENGELFWFHRQSEMIIEK